MTTAAIHMLSTPARAAAPLRLPRWHKRFYIQRLLVDSYRAMIDKHLAGRAGLTLVDYGCGDMPYRSLFEPHVSRHIGADLPGNSAASATIGVDGRLALPDGSADVIVSSQVLEHVDDPADYMAECLRVLKPGGQLMLSTHGSWWYHPHPRDFWRWTGEGLTKLIGDAGFTHTEITGLMGLASAGVYLVQDGVTRRIPRFIRPGLFLFTQMAAALLDRLHTDADRRKDAAVYVTHSVKPGAGAAAGSDA